MTSANSNQPPLRARAAQALTEEERVRKLAEYEAQADRVRAADPAERAEEKWVLYVSWPHLGEGYREVAPLGQARSGFSTAEEAIAWRDRLVASDKNWYSHAEWALEEVTRSRKYLP